MRDLAGSLRSAFAKHKKEPATAVTAATSSPTPATDEDSVAGLATDATSTRLVADRPATKWHPVAGLNHYVAAVAGVANEKRNGPQSDQDHEIAVDESVAFEERAAFIEHDGGVPRAWAEALARLDPSHQPADVPPKRWVLFLNDCGTFIDSAWVNRAIELGWTPRDLFGCHETKPYARLSHCGLLWLLNGRRILSMDTHRAVIETETGSVTYRRVPNEPGQVCVWELKGAEGRDRRRA